MATAHKLARIIYSMLKYGQKYMDAGAAYYEEQHRQRALSNANRRVAHLDYKLVPTTDTQKEQPNTAPAHVPLS